ncbi:MAG TPA: hypothetical protein VN025_15525 [Candidatus Dormibacteraeota bacterium]|nr:hypothetical protein [Candidatus Dormibacteraeota bacterium]
MMNHPNGFDQGNHFLHWALLNPSTYFAPAMALAGIFVWGMNLLPQGLCASPRRLCASVILGTLIYPVGIVTIFFVILILMSGIFGRSSHLIELPVLAQDTWGRLLDALPGTALLCAIGVLTVFLTALLFRLATGYLPRKKFLWGFLISSSAIFMTIVIQLLRMMPAYKGISIIRYLELYAQDMLFFSLISGVQLPAVIGAPLLAALLGHWLYLAGQKHAISAA